MNRLVSTDRNLAQQIYDFIVQLIEDVKDAGRRLMQNNKNYSQMQNLSKNTESLQQISDLFLTALGDTEGMSQQIEASEGDEMYSKRTLPDGKQYVEADRNVITGNNPQVWRKQITDYINSTIRNGKDVTVYGADGDALTITRDTAGKAAFRNYVKAADGTKRFMTDAEYKVKLRAESHIDEIAETSTRGNNVVKDYKNHPFAKDGFNYRTAYFKDGNNSYKITLSVGIHGEIKTVYNVGKMQETALPYVGKSLSGSKAKSAWAASTDSITATDDDVKYSIRGTDSEGNKLTAAQHKFFKDSKVVDEQGQLLVMYHGTGTTINEFQESFTGQGNDQYGSGFYFTNSEEEAQAYTVKDKNGMDKPGGMDQPNVVPAYVNITKPIIVNGASLNDAPVDLTQAQAEIIIRKAPNVRAQDGPMSDWHDITRGGVKAWMFTDVARNYTGASLISLENDFYHNDATAFRNAVRDVLGYDGVITTFDNGKQHSVAWFPVQIKRIDNQSPTASPDIRFSMREENPSGTMERLLAENANLREANELLSGQLKLTDRNQISPETTAKISKKILREYSSQLDSAKFEENLSTLFGYMLQEKDPDLQAVYEDFAGIGYQVIDQSRSVDKTLYNNYKNVRDYLRNTSITLSENQRSEASARYDGYGSYRKSLFGSVNLKKEGTPLDIAWMELSNMAPELFDEDIADVDMPDRLAEIVEQLRPQYTNEYEMDRDEAAADVMMRIFRRIPIRAQSGDACG